MKKCAVETAARNAKGLLKGEHEDFRKVLETVPKFAAELATEIFEEQLQDSGTSRYRCPYAMCRKTNVLETVAELPINAIRACNYCRTCHSVSLWHDNLVRED